jgi:ATP-binding cassette subfamily C protein
LDRVLPKRSIFRTAWRILRSLAAGEPHRLALIFAGQFTVGLFENISLIALLPLLQLLLEADAAQHSELSRLTRDLLERIGVPITLSGMLLFIVAIIALKAALKGLVTVYSGLSIQRQNQRLRKEFARQTVQARWAYLLDQPAGRLTNIMGMEIQNYIAAAGASVGLVSRSIQATVYMATSLLVSWKLTIAGIAVGAALMALMVPILSIVRRASHQRTSLMNSISSRLVETLQGMKALKSMAREGHIVPLLEAESEQIYQTQRTTTIGSAVRAILPEPLLISALAVGLFVSVGVFNIELPSLAVLAILFMRITNELAFINKFLHQIGMHEGSVAIVDDALRETAANREILHKGEVPTLRKGIELEDVDLSYGEKRVLFGVDLTIPAKKLTVVVGPSGSGKTSLLDAIVGFVALDKGRLTIDGVPLGNIDLRTWRGMIGYVPQELFLFNDTIRANITLGDQGLSDKDVERALKAAEAWEFIKALPEGLDTMTGERGMRLSGGQRQRLSIARALVRQPKLLMLDEATSALDPETELEICRMVQKLTKKFTVLAVTHQRAFLRVADQAVEISNGTARALDLEHIR